MEFQCRVIVQRRCTSSCSSVENIPLQAERHSARRQKLFAFPPESAFTFRPEFCSESQRNRVRLHSGIAFTFDRIPHLCDECGVSVRHDCRVAGLARATYLYPSVKAAERTRTLVSSQSVIGEIKLN